jgi:hypothetical protein
MSYFSTVTARPADGGNLDAFSRTRVSVPEGIFDSQFTYNLNSLIYEPITNGSGATVTHDATNRTALMTFSSTPTGGKAFLQSYEYIPYQPGHSQQIFVTFNFVETMSNVLKFTGYSDGTNGIEFQLNGTTKQFTLYSGTGNGTQTVASTSWNLDKLDGAGGSTNPSGITLDITKVQILVIDFQALYAGRVRIGFDIGGQVIYAHQFLAANTITTTYIQSANLPIRCGMTCTGTVSTTMNFICSSVLSEGGTIDIRGRSFAVEGGVTASSGARTHILSIRPKTTFNSITNRVKFELESVGMEVSGANPVYWELCIGQAISGTTTFADVNSTYSAFEFNTAGTISGSPSLVISSGYTGQASGSGSSIIPINNKYPITLDAAGAVRSLGTLTALVTGETGTSVCRLALNWREIR